MTTLGHGEKIRDTIVGAALIAGAAIAVNSLDEPVWSLAGIAFCILAYCIWRKEVEGEL